MAIIGLSNLRYAKMTQEETTDTAPTYGGIKRIVGVNSVSENPENDTATLYGDNKAIQTITTTKETGITLTTARLPLENRAELLGHNYNSETKVMVVNTDDAASNVALMYELDTDEGDKILKIWYKGKFAESSQENNTRGESTEFELENLDGTFVARIDNGNVSKVKLVEAGEQITADGWFKSELGIE